MNTFSYSKLTAFWACLLSIVGGWPGSGWAQGLDPAFAPTQLALPAATDNAAQLTDGRLVVSIIPSAYYQGLRVPGLIHLNSDGSLDQSYTASWLQGGGKANSMRALPNGKLFVVGTSFSVLESLGGLDLYRQTGVVVLNADGTLDRQFAVNAQSQANVGEVQPDGKILIGGSFTAVNGTALNRLARLLPNGQTDPTFGLAAGGFDGEVTSIHMQPDGKILVGGNFNTCGGVARPHLARLLPDGSLDTTFVPAIPTSVFFDGFAVQADGKVVVTTATAGLGLFRLLANGTRDNTFTASNYSYGALNPVSDQPVVVQASGAILLAGCFDHANGQPSPGLMRASSTGILDAGPNSPYHTDCHGVVTSLCPLADGSTLACGSFTVFNHQATGIVRISAAGQVTPFALPVGSIGTIAAVLPTSKGLLVGGDFSAINGTPATNLAFLRTDGTVDVAATQALPPLDGPVQALAPGMPGLYYVGGYFYDSSTPNRNYLVRLTSSGSPDLTFTAPSLNSGVVTLGSYPDGRVLLGGGFTTPKTNLLRLSPQGNIDYSFTAGFGQYVPWVSALVVQRDERLAALTLYTSWQLEPQGAVTGQSTTVPRYLHALAVQPDGRILVAGEFSSFAGATHNSVVRLLASGAVDASFDAGTILMQNDIPRIKALAIQADGRILCAGFFTSIQGQPHRGVARLLASGQVDNTFADLVNLHPEATCLVIQPGGRLLVGASALSPQATSYLSNLTLTQGLTCLVVPGLTGSAPAGLPLVAPPPAASTEISIFPVPAHDELTVQAGPATTLLSVTIYDVMGRVMRQADDTAAIQAISVADLPAATYIVRIYSNRETVYRQLVVQH